MADEIKNLDDIPEFSIIEEIKDSMVIINLAESKENWILFPRSCRREAVTIASNKEYHVRLHMVDISLIEGVKSSKEEEDNTLSESAQNSRYMEAFKDLITKVIKYGGVSDIHIEYSRSGVSKVRLRSGGRLVDFLEWDSEFTNKLVMVLFKVKAQKSLDERKPMDASVEMHIDGVHMMLRLAFIPIRDGHDTTIRLLIMKTKEGGSSVLPLEASGYSKQQIIQIRTAILTPQRLVLICGTTGSGKSTTIQSMLTEQIRKDPYSKVRTVEDPVEYIIENARQSQVTEGVSFDDFLVSVMRGDPDTIGVGEIRDEASAAVTEKATLTGHKVYGTLHAASAMAAFPRLEDIGVKRNIMASKDFFNMIMYQKLIPHTCPKCMVKMLTEEGEKLGIEIQGSEQSWEAAKKRWMFFARITKNVDLNNVNLHNPSGCGNCVGGLLKKRSVAAEVLIPDMKFLELISQRKDFEAWAHWRSNGGMTVNEHSASKVFEGFVCPVVSEMYVGPVTADEINKDGVIEAEETMLGGGYAE